MLHEDMQVATFLGEKVAQCVVREELPLPRVVPLARASPACLHAYSAHD